MINTLDKPIDETPHPSQREFWSQLRPLADAELYEIRSNVFEQGHQISIGFSMLDHSELWQVEQVIQLKRIADALERIAGKS